MIMVESYYARSASLGAGFSWTAPPSWSQCWRCRPQNFLLPCGESPVFTVVESQCRASVVPLSRADDENGETMVVTVA